MKNQKKIFLILSISIFTIAVAFVGAKNFSHDSKNSLLADTGVRELQNTLRNVSATILPSVVQLDVTDVQTLKSNKRSLPFPFDFFFKDMPGNEAEEEEREYRRQGLGSGAIVKNNGNKYYVLTNEHVVGGADEIKIILYDKREYDGKVVGSDKRKDLALVVFETKEKNIEVAKLGDSNKLAVGDFVLAIGSPLGFTSSVTFGIVSAIGRDGPSDNINDFIQTDASINQGNSGGPLVDLDGNIVGINTWIASRTGENSGLGFSIPINNAKQVINDIINKGSVEYGWLGVSISDVSSDLAESLGYKDKKGAFVSNVYLNSPAEKSGIIAGTIITEVDGVKINDSSQLVRAVANLHPGKDYNFKIFTNKKNISTNVNIAIRETEADILKNSTNLWPGVNVHPVTKEIVKKLSLNDQEGIVVVSAEKDSKLYVGGLRSGDLITSINNNKINNLQDFYKEIAKDGNILIEYKRKNSDYYLGVRK